MDLGFSHGALVGLDVMASHANPDWARCWISNRFRWLRIRNGADDARRIHPHRWVVGTSDSIGRLMGRTNLTICGHSDSTIRGTKLGRHESRHRHLDDSVVCFRTTAMMTIVEIRDLAELLPGRSLL